MAIAGPLFRPQPADEDANGVRVPRFTVRRDGRRTVVARFVLEHCRPDPGAEVRAALRLVDPTRSPRLSTGGLTCFDVTPEVAMRRVVDRLDVAPARLAVAEHPHPLGCARILGPSARPDLDGDAPVELAEIADGLTLAEAHAALAACQQGRA